MKIVNKIELLCLLYECSAFSLFCLHFSANGRVDGKTQPSIFRSLFISYISKLYVKALLFGWCRLSSMGFLSTFELSLHHGKWKKSFKRTSKGQKPPFWVPMMPVNGYYQSFRHKCKR